MRKPLLTRQYSPGGSLRKSSAQTTMKVDTSDINPFVFKIAEKIESIDFNVREIMNKGKR